MKKKIAVIMIICCNMIHAQNINGSTMTFSDSITVTPLISVFFLISTMW